ncbi:uncharacterized protein HD556DRAFT_981453 [Suillus plorans]|uniref:Uncharacterized protein n=1 Tax=Suillus plorans TaxID=116603 RepID=A0A9P7DC52_9AGAM|nr:uncharacterized protein HD556DRAFT_981453 [Suillus plorans]KAG1787357.1 hypothetical protein HD556DRAFT_981453 [Suillus plorans]
MWKLARFWLPVCIAVDGKDPRHSHIDGISTMMVEALTGHNFLTTPARYPRCSLHHPEKPPRQVPSTNTMTRCKYSMCSVENILGLIYGE